MRILVAVASNEEELHRARKHMGYERLVVLAPEGGAQRLARALAPEDKAEVVELPRHDLLACMEQAESLLRGLEGEVRVAADGGTLAMQGGVLLACLSTGTEVWFLQHKPVRLPMLRAMPVERRFTDDQAAVLRALSADMPAEQVARRAGIPDERAKRALLALRKLDAIHSDAKGVALTRLGAYYRGALG